MSVPLSLAAVILLIAANGFFVATEFALVAVRRTRIEQLAAAGNPSARSVRDALDHLDAYIAATQLGITMASLALGWIGEPAIARLIEPAVSAVPLLPAEARDMAAHAVSAALAFAIITMLHIVLGELAPKSIALQRAEATVLAVTRPIHWFAAVFRLPIVALNSIGNAVVKTFGIQPAAGHTLVQSAEELKLAVAASREAGLVDEAAQEVVDRALDFTELEAHHVMIPRPEIVALPQDASAERVVDVARRHQHSRYPVFDGSVDNIVGVVSATQLIGAVADHDAGRRRFDLRREMAPPFFVPETIKAYKLLGQMQRGRQHMAVLLDEYGITAGVVTIRDLVARIVGEVPDEGEGGEADVRVMGDGTALVDGLAPLTILEDQIGIELPEAAEDEYDTVGGFVFGQLGRRPAVGDVIEISGRVVVVDELDGLRISRVRVLPAPAGPAVFESERSTTAR